MYDLNLFHRINAGYVGKGFQSHWGISFGIYWASPYIPVKVQPLLLLQSEQFPEATRKNRKNPTRLHPIRPHRYRGHRNIRGCHLKHQGNLEDGPPVSR